LKVKTRHVLGSIAETLERCPADFEFDREGALKLLPTRHVLGSITDTLERCPADFEFDREGALQLLPTRHVLGSIADTLEQCPADFEFDREGALQLLPTRHVPGSIAETLERCPADFKLQTGSISPQFHVVFNDLFSMVMSIGIEDDAPDFWKTLWIDSRLQKKIKKKFKDAS
jgi:hypothetical protein